MRLGIEPNEELVWLGSEWLVKEVNGWTITVSPMIFNDRICLASRTDVAEKSYTAGFCYDKGPAAVLAAKIWNPETELRPVGFKKEAYNTRTPGWWRRCTPGQLKEMVDQWHARYDGREPYDVLPLNEWLGMSTYDYNRFAEQEGTP